MRIFLLTIFSLFSFLTINVSAEENLVTLEEEYIQNGNIMRVYKMSDGSRTNYEIKVPSNLDTDLDLNSLLNIKKALTLYYMDNNLVDELYILDTAYSPNINSDINIDINLFNRLISDKTTSHEYADKIISERTKEEEKHNIDNKEKDPNSVSLDELVSNKDEETDEEDIKNDKSNPVIINGNSNTGENEQFIDGNENISNDNEDIKLDDHNDSSWNAFFIVLGILLVLTVIILIWKRKWLFS